MKLDGTKLPLAARMRTLWYSLRLAHRLIPAFFPAMLTEAFLKAAQPLVVLFFSARVISELAGGRNMRALILYASLTVGLAFVLAAGRAAAEYRRESVAGWTQVAERARLLQAERFAAMDFAYTEDTRVSETLARMDTLARGNGLGLIGVYEHTARIAEHCFTLCLSLPLLAGLNMIGGGWRGGAGLLFLIMAAGTFALQRARERRGAAMIAANEKANTAAGFYLRYIKPDQAAKDIRLYRQTPALLTLFRESFRMDQWLAFFRFGGHVGGFTAAMLSLIGGVFYLLVGSAALDGGAAAGDVVQSVGAATALAAAAGSLLVMLGELYQNIPYLQPLRDFLELPDLLEKGRRPVPQMGVEDCEIEFKNVSFRYPGAADFALKNLNLKLTPGKRLAVVGRNGSGKTTMIKLLCRLYDPTEGEILLDGVNIREYDHTQYTALFSVVFQDYTLFPLALGRNVAAAQHCDEERAADCLTRAGFGPRLATMPGGLDTVLYKSFDEDGVQVSGGEAQKIALARALYRDAQVVILDEPTAALDPEAEHEVYTAFNRNLAAKTAVFISHRLSSCRFADEIAVFDAGELVQHGGHDALVTDRAGKYFELWDAQAGYYVEE